MLLRLLAALLLLAPSVAPFHLAACAQENERAVTPPTFYRTIEIDGLSISYREAGAKDAPALLLLHGFPSSSRMYQPLLARLADRYRLIAPDYPGFGHSDWPDPKTFAYTFDHIAAVMDRFTEALGLARYTLYMQDYGMALAHPERIEALIVQNAVAHNEGLGALWATRGHHLGSDPDADRDDPDLWTDKFAFLSKPGQADIQTDLFYDYRTNVEAYPRRQAWLSQRQPRLLVLWGKYDPSFDISELEADRRNVPKAEVHVLNAGHFALDTGADEIARLVRGFMN